jgi:glycosyltransferase involved in cell wall biosynthesis
MQGNSRRKRILHVVEDLKVGGLERVIETIVISLDRQKYDTEVWCLARGGAIAEELLQYGTTVRILGLTSYHHPSRVCELSRMLKAGGFDVVHTHGYYASTFARLALLLAQGPAIIHHIHTTDIHFKPRHRKIEALLSLLTDRVICVSSAVREFAVETLSVAPQKTRVVYNTAFANPACGGTRESARRGLLHGVSEEDFVVLSIASLTLNKGHDILLLAMRDLVARHGNTRCVLIGDGPHRRSLESRIDQLGLRSHVFLAGLQMDVMPYLQMADAAALATINREGLSVALIEAAAAGLPLLGSDLGGIPEVIEHGVNGFLFTPGDANALAGAIERLIEDPALRERMGRQSREKFETRFSRQIMISRIEQIYDELLRGRAHAV